MDEVALELEALELELNGQSRIEMDRVGMASNAISH